MSMQIFPASEMAEDIANPTVQELTLKFLDAAEGQPHRVVASALFHLDLAMKKQRHEANGALLLDGSSLREHMRYGQELC